MFNFTTNTIINSDKDVNGNAMFSAVAGESFFVSKTGKFLTANVQEINGTKVFKTPYEASSNFKIIFATDGSFVPNLFYRMIVDIKLSGARQSDYANAVDISRSVYYEFKGGANGLETLEEIKKVIDYRNARFAGEALLTATVDTVEEQLTLNGTDFYQFVVSIRFEKLDETTDLWVSADDLFGIDSITQGGQGFGTYDRIIKDLRLPTIENMRYKAVHGNEMPLINGKYSQYLLYYKKDRGVLGSDAVGQSVTSTTIHSFYVESAYVTAFENALKSATLMA